MERKDFLKNSLGFLGMALILPKLTGCNGSDDTTVIVDDGGGSNTGGNTECKSWPTETEGPFPTKNPSSYQIINIKGDRTGVACEIKIKIEDVNNDCAAAEGIFIDIWHCDKDGNYSQYGATNMQQADYRDYNFLRGRQTTASNGYVTFQSIFPGWYQGRATHIHVHVYKANGTSLKVTQIAFPEGSNSAVITVNAATDYGYTKGMSSYTYNTKDNVFSDDTTGQQIATVTGSVANGYTVEAIIKVPI
ncbi:dioxygenase family protein [Paenimyroides baculatum]|uniref:Intradiol ring-cleavage dioxygenase n=1 Tax=Paenimyroides baculatum TaxID=2608000 RepID=A0A5M6CHS7_9FLAO|nr:intradiol ring-cleavage dioxygenase [Paenimyroides baculatum]KAA5532935.1 intradiol ring-cleavage dioxygenase [Paenimyroides baculatum]